MKMSFCLGSFWRSESGEEEGEEEEEEGEEENWSDARNGHKPIGQQGWSKRLTEGTSSLTGHRHTPQPPSPSSASSGIASNVERKRSHSADELISYRQKERGHLKTRLVINLAF